MSRFFAFALLFIIGILLLGTSACDNTVKVTTPPTSDIRSHGAKGDGTTDDTAAFQKAIDSSVGVIRLGKGTYKLTKTVVVDLDKVGFTSINGDGVARVVMAGPGPAFRFVGTHQGTAGPTSVKDNVWKNQRMPVIDGVEIVGDHDEACGIEATGTVMLTISRLQVRKALHGIHLTKRNRNILIESCHLYDNRGIGVYYDDVNLHQSNITGCHISYNRQGGIVSRKGDVRNVHITGCDIEDNMSTDGPATANVFIDCAGSLTGTGEVAITGCTIQHGRHGKDGANIRIFGKAKPTKDEPVVRQGHVTITGNVLSDVQTNIHLKGCRGVTIQGNTFWEGFTHNLLVEDSVSVVVGPNSLDRNPYYERYGKAREARNSVIFSECADCSITGLHLTGNRHEDALVVKKCRRMLLTGCTILGCEKVGLRLEDTLSSRVSGCVIRSDGVQQEKPKTKAEILKQALNLSSRKSVVVKGGKLNVLINNAFGDGHDVEKGTARMVGNDAGE